MSVSGFYLTSFKVAYELGFANHEDNEVWSSAVSQPHWYPQRPKAGWMDIRPVAGGTWIRPREFISMDKPLEGYFQALQELYNSRRDEALEWAETRPVPNVVICCWCPYDKAAQRQLAEHGSFVCHTAAVGEFLKGLGFGVVADEDRKKMVLP